MTITELRNFLKAIDALEARLPDNLTVALLKIHAGMSRKEIQQHVQIDELQRAGWVEQINSRIRLTVSAKTRLGLAGRKKKEADPRMDELIREYREIIKEARHFDPCDPGHTLHEYGGLAKAAKVILNEAGIHPKLKDKTPEEQFQGLVRIMRAMAYTEDKYDLRTFEAQRWHLWAFARQLFKYISQMLAVQDRVDRRSSKAQSKVEKPIETGRTSL